MPLQLPMYQLHKVPTSGTEIPQRKTKISVNRTIGLVQIAEGHISLVYLTGEAGHKESRLGLLRDQSLVTRKTRNIQN
jgi:hypothetical protein